MGCEYERWEGEDGKRHVLGGWIPRRSAGWWGLGSGAPGVMAEAVPVTTFRLAPQEARRSLGC